MRNAEQEEILGWFHWLLAAPTGDGGNKRAAGTKPFWKVDTSHPAASGRHRSKYAAGEIYDLESGAHHLSHSGWRDLASAFQDMTDDGLIPEGPPPLLVYVERSRVLADAAAAHLVCPSIENARAMQDALHAFTDARKVLDG